MSLLALAGVDAQLARAGHDQARVRITLEPGSATNTVGEQHCVIARVRDPGHGNQPVVGAQVRFSVTGANTAAGVGITDTTGRTTFCYVGTNSGNDLITAFVDFNRNALHDTGEPSATATKTWLAGPPVTLTLTPAAAENTVGSEHCVTASAADAFGNPTPNVSIVFTVTGANPTGGTRTTDLTGEATFCYTGMNAGLDAITAFADTNRSGSRDAGEPAAAAAKTYTSLGPSSLTLEPPASENPAGTEHCVTATARNVLGAPSAGVRIVFSVTGAHTEGGTRVTDSAGQAVFCYTGTVVGLDVIDAFADTDEDGARDAGEPSATATKAWTPGAPATVIVEPPFMENVVGTEHCVLATVRDAFGNPVPGVVVRFSVAGANTAAGTDTTDANGTATFCYTGTIAGLDTIEAHADTDADAEVDAGEPVGVATKLYHPGAPASLVLDPRVAVNVVGTRHCVTATVRDAFGNPVPEVSVVFAVTGSVTTGGTVQTDAEGEAEFCYDGPELPGADVITAFADTDDDGELDAGEPTDVAEKTWVVPPTTPLCEIIVNNGGWIVAANGDRGSFGGNSKADGDGNPSGVQEYQDHGPARPMNVHSTRILAVVCDFEERRAEIYGEARVDGIDGFVFKIEVSDGGEPGTGRDTYRILVSNGYDSGIRPLQGGNVQIR